MAYPSRLGGTARVSLFVGCVGLGRTGRGIVLRLGLGLFDDVDKVGKAVERLGGGLGVGFVVVTRGVGSVVGGIDNMRLQEDCASISSMVGKGGTTTGGGSGFTGAEDNDLNGPLYPSGRLRVEVRPPLALLLLLLLVVVLLSMEGSDEGMDKDGVDDSRALVSIGRPVLGVVGGMLNLGRFKGEGGAGGGVVGEGSKDGDTADNALGVVGVVSIVGVVGVTGRGRRLPLGNGSNDDGRGPVLTVLRCLTSSSLINCQTGRITGKTSVDLRKSATCCRLSLRSPSFQMKSRLASRRSLRLSKRECKRSSVKPANIRWAAVLKIVDEVICSVSELSPSLSQRAGLSAIERLSFSNETAVSCFS